MKALLVSLLVAAVCILHAPCFACIPSGSQISYEELQSMLLDPAYEFQMPDRLMRLFEDLEIDNLSILVTDPPEILFDDSE